MRIVHASDWHGFFGPYRTIPEADLYVFTGDMLPNYPGDVYRRRRGPGGVLPPGEKVVFCDDRRDWDEGEFKRLWCRTGERRIDPKHEVERQLAFIERAAISLPPHSKVIALRGNHDFVSYRELFRNCDVLTLDSDNGQLVEIGGLKFWLQEGVPPISGEWWGEMSEDVIRTHLPPDDCHPDVLVTHCPPMGFADEVPDSLYGYGSVAMSGYIERRWNLMTYGAITPLKLHMFGHVHEGGGLIMEMNGTHFSNAATTLNVLEI